jgi:hypothetical protein
MRRQGAYAFMHSCRPTDFTGPPFQPSHAQTGPVHAGAISQASGHNWPAGRHCRNGRSLVRNRTQNHKRLPSVSHPQLIRSDCKRTQLRDGARNAGQGGANDIVKRYLDKSWEQVLQPIEFKKTFADCKNFDNWDRSSSFGT